MKCPCCGQHVAGEHVLVSLERNTIAFREHVLALFPKHAEIMHELAIAMPGVASFDRLIAQLWGAHPPDDGMNALRVHVSALRKLLPPGLEIVTAHSRGYSLHVVDQRTTMGGHNGRTADPATRDRRVPR